MSWLIKLTNEEIENLKKELIRNGWTISVISVHFSDIFKIMIFISSSILSKLLVVVELFVAFTSIAGGLGLIFTQGLGMPLEQLKNSPFVSYFWPGVILAAVVGGTHLLAAFMLIKKNKLAPEFSAIAGFGLLIWIFTEMYIIAHFFFLQIMYFGLGILTLSLTFLLLRNTAKVFNK